MNNLRIYIVIATFHPIVGGAEKQALMQAKILRERGHEVSIITFHHEQNWQAQTVVEGVPVRRVAGMLLHKRHLLPRLLQRLCYLLAMLVMGWTLWWQRQRYDLVHVYQLNLLALPAALACLFTRRPLIVAVRSALLKDPTASLAEAGQLSLVAGPVDPTASWLRVDNTTRVIHDLGDLERFGSGIMRLTHFLLKRQQAVIVVLSSRMKEYLAAYHFTLPGTQLIPNGVDTNRFRPTREVNEQAEQAVICVSRLSYEKGLDVLLQAWPLVHKQMPEARLIIVGDGPLKPQLLMLVEALGIAEQVEFSGAQSNVPAQLQRARLAVLPSRHEGMPNAVLEAMAAGLPCVATRVSGSEDIIQPDVNGLLVEIEDYQGMARALLTLLKDPALVKQYAEAARSTIENSYSLEHITNLYEQLYQNITNKRREGVKQQAYSGV